MALLETFTKASSALLLGRPATALRAPEPISDALAASGMSPETELGPGRPLEPSEGFSGVPRRFDYPATANTSLDSRTRYGRTSFELLRELMRVYGVAQDCKNHKIDELRSMEPLFTPAPGARGDVDFAVELAKKALAYPDREHPYDEWVSMLMENMLTFDAGPVRRRRTMDGQVFAWEIIDGPTILPYIDEHGRRPKAPAPAYFQKIKGRVQQWFTTDDMYYLRFRPQTDSPYGMAPLESILLNVNTDVRFQWHLLQMFTAGSIPGGFMEVPPDTSSPDQVLEWQNYWNALYRGDQAIAGQLIAVPNGAKYTETTPRTFDKAFPEYMALQTARSFGVVPQDIGILSDVNRSTADAQMDTQFRVKTLVWVYFMQGLLNRMIQQDLGLPVQVRLDTGREKEDRLVEAQAWKIYIESGMASADEGREELLGLPIDNESPTPRVMIVGQTMLPLPKGGDTDAESMVDEEPKAPGAVEPSMPAPKALPAPAPTGGQAVTKELAKWRQNARGRVKRGQAPRRFESEVLKAEVVDRVWEVLRHADDLAAVDEAFVKGEAAADPKGPGDGTPDWRALPPDAQPQHKIDLPLTDFWQPRVSDALNALLTDGDLTDAAQAAAAQVTKASVDDTDPVDSLYQKAARAVLTDRIKPGSLEDTLKGLWADAYRSGALAAEVQMGAVPAGWDDWVPGITNADLITGGGGLQGALDAADVTIKGITGHTLDRLAATVEQGVLDGDPVDTIGRSLRGILGDPARAQLIAHTESARLLTDASMDVYSSYGVELWDLVKSVGACPVCRDIFAGNPHRVNDGTPTPPVHPRCRCAAAPHMEGL